MSDLISVVIPVYNEGKCIVQNISKIISVLDGFSFGYEILLIDDGSTDDTWDKIKYLKTLKNSLYGLHFSRNFGKEGAIFAGLDNAKGDACVIMDSDLQHPPQLVGKMYDIWKQGIQVVEAVKSDRGNESKINLLCANSFYAVLEKLSGIELKNASDYRFMDKEVVQALKAMPERQTFFRAMSTWVGFKRERVFFEVPQREDGASKWSRLKLLKLAISAITSFSNLPMQFVTICGAIFSVFSFALLAQTMYMYFSGKAQGGFTTVIVLLLLIGSILMFSIGILGGYIAKIYEEIKARPRYIVSEKV